MYEICNIVKSLGMDLPTTDSGMGGGAKQNTCSYCTRPLMCTAMNRDRAMHMAVYIFTTPICDKSKNLIQKHRL